MSTRNFTTDKLTIERLREVLHYDPETGIFTWRVRLNNSTAAGSAAGCLKPNGYIHIRIDGVLHQAHRLVLYWVNGVASSSGDVDHRDHNRSNNVFVNLREATRSENMQNTRKPRDNKSGFKGVSWNKERKKWAAFIRTAGKSKNLGNFTNIEDAVEARKAAEILYHPFRVIAG